MRQAGLICRRKSRYVHTTDSKHGELVYPNLIKDLPIESRESVLGSRSDVCTPAGGQGLAFLACWTPTPGSALAGACLATWIPHCRGKRLSMALAQRQVTAGLIHHSD